ncbi:MAG: TadE family protein [Glaciihabitans sp.]
MSESPASDDGARPRPLHLRADAGSALAEFTIVAALLTVLTLSVIQLGLALHIRNTLLDAAAEGARYGSVADTGPDEGANRTRELITLAIGPGYATDVSAGIETFRDQPALAVTVRAPLPLIGLIGVGEGLEVTGHAPLEAR